MRLIISGVPKNELLLVKYFLSGYELKVIEILYTVIQEYSLHFYAISKNLVASYASIVQLQMIFQKIL